MGNFLHYDFTTVDTNPTLAVGTVVWEGSKAYKYVKFLDAVTYVAGHVLYPANTAGTSVTNDTSGGSALAALACGYGTAVHTQNSYGWMQIAGVVSAIGGGSVTAGSPVAPGTDGTVVNYTDGAEELVCGVALEDDSGSPVRCSVLIKNCM